jgi:hypothetical protein
VEPEPGDHVLRRDVVHPTHGVAPIRAVLVRARRDVDELRGHALVVERRWRRRDGPFLVRGQRHRADEQHGVAERSLWVVDRRFGAIVGPPPGRVGAVQRGAAEPVEAEHGGVDEDAVVVAVPVGGVQSSKRCGNCTKAVSSPWRASSMKHMAARKAEELLM